MRCVLGSILPLHAKPECDAGQSSIGIEVGEKVRSKPYEFRKKTAVLRLTGNEVMYRDSLASFLENKGREIPPEKLDVSSRFRRRVVHVVKCHPCRSLHDAIVHSSITIGRCWSASSGIFTASIDEVVSHVSI